MRTFFVINGATPACTTDSGTYFNNMKQDDAHPVSSFVFGLASSNQGPVLIVGANQFPQHFHVHPPLVKAFLKTPEGVNEKANGFQLTGLGRYFPSNTTFQWDCVCMERKFTTSICEELRPPIEAVFKSFTP